MPKLKTHSGAKKRFNLTKSGKVKRAHAFKSHILTKKGHQAAAACAELSCCEACGGKFRCGGNPRGDIFTAGKSMPRFFQAVKKSGTALSKREIPRVMLLRLDLFPTRW